eukprot:4135785-Amphidinium_carterae.1
MWLWSTSVAVLGGDVDTLWNNWCRAAETALGLRTCVENFFWDSRNSLRDNRKRKRLPVPDSMIRLPILRGSSWKPDLAPSLSGSASCRVKCLLLSFDSLPLLNTGVGEKRQEIYKWIRGTAAVWDLAITHENGFALSPDDTAVAELAAWSKLWQPGTVDFPQRATSKSAWSTDDVNNIISHCPLGKARGVDRQFQRRGQRSLRALHVPLWRFSSHGATGSAQEPVNLWQQGYRPSFTSPGASSRSPRLAYGSALGPLWPPRGAFSTPQCSKQTTAAGVPQAGVFLACTKCYERVPLHILEQFALESGYPLDSHSWYAVHLLHAFLLKTLQSAGGQLTVRKYVDDMVLVAKGPNFASKLCHGYRQVPKIFAQANVLVNLKKTEVICNGTKAKRLLMKVWRHGRLPPPHNHSRLRRGHALVSCAAQMRPFANLCYESTR